jgi:hypothetical protein
MRELPPGTPFLIGIGVICIGLAMFAGYLFYRSNQVSPKGLLLVIVPAMAIAVLYFIVRGSDKSE